MPLASNYLKDGYYESEGVLKESLLLDDAKNVAKVFGIARPTVSTHQLRVFYNHCKAILSLLDNVEYSRVKHNIAKLPALAGNGRGRGTLPQEFVDFIEKNVLLVSSEKDFRVFMEHFQAVVGWYRALYPRN